MAKRKGFTLLEMSIVISLVAIISLAVVSFSIMMSNRAKANKDKMAVVQEITMVETVVEAWFDSVYTDGQEIAVVDGVLTCGEYYIKIVDRALCVKSASTENTIELESAFSIMVTAEENTKGNKLYICTLNYLEGNTIKNINFTVYPRVGQGIGA